MNTVQFEAPMARENHKALLLALGSENNPGQWMVFMETVERLLPELSEKGRLTQDALNRTFIGQLGFGSWKEYVEADAGLSWKIGGWNAYRRAWTALKSAPYLREMDVKAGWVNSMSRSLAKEDREFPQTREEFDALVEEREQQKLEEKESQKSALLEKIELLEKSLADSKAEMTEFKAKAQQADLALKAAKNEAQALLLEKEKQLADKDASLEKRSAEVAELNRVNGALEMKLQEPKPVSRLEGLRIFFTGG